ncbi:hypothetical protein D3C72_2030770 [compost metagenome]
MACRGQRCLAPSAHNQRGFQPGLQLLDVQADGGRRQMQGLRGCRERAQIGDGHQGLQLVKVEVAHGIDIRIYELTGQLIQLYRC